MSPGRNTCHPVRSTGFILEPMCYKARTDSFKLFSDFQVSPILCLHQHTQTHKQIDINKTNGNKIFNILWTFLIFCRYLSTVENIVLPPQRINEPGQWTFGLAVCSSIYIVMFTAWMAGSKQLLYVSVYYVSTRIYLKPEITLVKKNSPNYLCPPFLLFFVHQLRLSSDWLRHCLPWPL